MVEISNKNNNKVVRVSVGGSTGNNPTIKPNGDYSSYYSELSKAWAIKMNGMVSKEDYSSKYYATQAKANAETTENNLNSVISEHEQITNEITEARENISGDLTGALTDIVNARDNGVAKVIETKTNSLSEIESAKSEAEQTITTGLNNFNTNAQAKSDSLQKQFDTSISDIKKQETTSINVVKTTQTTAESSITNLQSTAENTISNGIADIKSNKEQSMSAIDENRTTSIEEILANKTSSMNAIDKNRTDTLSEIDTMRSEAISNVEAVKTSAETSINDTKTSAKNSITDIKNTAISNVQNQESTTEANIDKKVQEALNKIPDIDDKLNISKMYKTGEISTDTTGYNQLVEMKRSTFDKSKFTVVGSPTITDDGIASGFSTSNYLRINQNIDFTKPFVIEGEFTTGSNILKEQFILSTTINQPFGVQGFRDGFLYVYYPTTTNAYKRTAQLSANTKYNYKYYYTGTELKLDVNNTTYTIASSEFNPTIATFINLGISRIASQPWSGSIDFKQFSITVDGKEVFSGNKTGTDTVKIGGETVEIPYTLSKTGSKIVDVAYRDKVQALYNQEGRADYYTIDETNQNFTLPMGEIYGMINSIKPSSGVELCTILCMPFGVDESENKYRYLNGQTIVQSQYPAFTAKVKSWQSTRASLFTTEEDWQAIKTASKLGQCGKFVIDDEAGIIRLPAIVNINGLTDLSKCGLIKDESLPNIKGDVNVSDTWGGTGALSTTGEQGYNPAATRINHTKIEFDASRSSSTYQDGAYVQQEAVQYPYVICVNTGVEEAERPINNYQVNNTNSLLECKYTDHKLNNLSWLRSQGQYNSGTIYNKAYELILKIYNGTETIEGISVKVKGDSSITDYDFVIDTTNTKFRLPIKSRLASGKAVVGNGVALGITDTFNNFGLAGSSNQPDRVYGNTGFYGINTGSKARAGIMLANDNALGVTTDGSKSGIETDDTGLYLYYYVGDTLQNADLINIARMQEMLTDKLDTPPRYVVEVSDKSLLPSWYIVYNDGWCEQGGAVSVNGPSYSTVTLLKKNINTNYALLATWNGNANKSSIYCYDKTTSNFKIDATAGDIADRASWEVKGYIS